MLNKEDYYDLYIKVNQALDTIFNYFPLVQKIEDKINNINFNEKTQTLFFENISDIYFVCFGEYGITFGYKVYYSDNRCTITYEFCLPAYFFEDPITYIKGKQEIYNNLLLEKK